MEYIRIIPGFVTQTYDEEGRCIDQCFDADSDEMWEDENGLSIDKPGFNTLYCGMEDPESHEFPYINPFLIFKTTHQPLPLDDNSDDNSDEDSDKSNQETT